MKKNLCRCKKLVSIVLLFAAIPSTVTAQTIGWDPAYLDFGIVLVGSTETRTLTLTNTDAIAALVVSGVEYTFNQQGVFGWSTAHSLPVALGPGESMEVALSFTPIDISFFMADLLVTSNALNTPNGLNYSFMGMGEYGDPCSPPLSNCGGLCIDLSNDLDNCGSCDNVCASPTNATAMCEAASCGFVCDEGYEPVGDLCQAIVAQTPLEMLDALIAFVDESVASGALVGLGPRGTDYQSAPYRLLLFTRALDRAADKLTNGDVAAACDALNIAQLHSDGGFPFTPPPDFIAGEASADVNARINAIMIAMETCEIREAATRPVK